MTIDFTALIQAIVINSLLELFKFIKTLSIYGDIDYAYNGIEGNGLGLSIAKQIIEEHNGTISAYHNDPKGLKIIINF